MTMIADDCAAIRTTDGKRDAGTMRAIGTVLVVCLVLAAKTASAFPDRPIRLLVSFPPGGSTDAMARIVQQGVEKLLGQPLVIENRPGAGGLIAIDAVAKSPPDGHVIGLGGTAALGSNQAFQTNAQDIRNDVAPVVPGLPDHPFILAAPRSYQGKSVRDVIALAKAQGDKLTLGHGGNGTSCI